MQLYRYLSNLYYLKRITDGKFIIKVESEEAIQTILRIIKQYRKDRHQFIRNQATSAIKEMRRENPYQPRDYSKAKEMYEDYHKLPNHIDNIWDSNDVVFLYKFRNEAPVKGGGYCEYFMNATSGGKTVFLLKDKSLFSKDFRTAYLYATQEQIDEYKERQEKVGCIDKLIEVYQEHINDLQKQKYEILNKEY